VAALTVIKLHLGRDQPIMGESKIALGPLETDILRYIGDHYPISVAEVADHVGETTGHARTTVLTVMDRLRKKGFLTRQKVEGVYRFSPKVPNSELLKDLVKDFVETTLGGSVSPFVAFLAEGGEISEDDLNMLKRLVRKAKGKGGR
jgi:predicted transcriptional regulator